MTITAAAVAVSVAFVATAGVTCITVRSRQPLGVNVLSKASIVANGLHLLLFAAAFRNGKLAAIAALFPDGVVVVADFPFRWIVAINGWH